MTAGATHAYPRRPTAWTAAVVFVLFAALVFALRFAARVDSPDLGLSAWGERGATEKRLEPVVDHLLNKAAIGAFIARHASASSANLPESQPKLWAAIDDMAGALTDDTAKARLSAAWAAGLARNEPAVTIRGKVREYLRLSAAPVEQAKAGDREIIDALASTYADALPPVVPGWLTDVLPPEAVEGFLYAKAPADPPDKPSEPVSATTVSQFAATVHGGVTSALTKERARRPVVTAIERDLRFGSAQESIVKAVGQDFAARWMWIITGAIFLIAAVSATLGAGWQVWCLAKPADRNKLVGAYVVALVAGLLYGLRAHGSLPPFLSNPLQEFGALYELSAAGAARLITLATAVSVAALLVSSWGSFLVETTDDRRLEAQLSTLRWSFLTGTLVMVAGVLHLYAFLQWPSASMAEPAAATVKEGAQWSALTLGAAFSILLLLIYLPGARVLVEEARARKAGAEPERAAAIDAMLVRLGFDQSATQQIVRFATAFAPLLIAPLGAGLMGLVTG